jgi:hypothetical protein
MRSCWTSARVRTRKKCDRKFERAALKYLRRYMDETNPSLADVAQVAPCLPSTS